MKTLNKQSVMATLGILVLYFLLAVFYTHILPGISGFAIKQRLHLPQIPKAFFFTVVTAPIIFFAVNLYHVWSKDDTGIAKEDKRVAEDQKNRQHQFASYVVENFPVDVAVFDKEHRYVLLNKTAVKNDEIRNWMIGKDDFDYFTLKGADLRIAEKRREKFLKAIGGRSQEWIDEHLVDGKLKYVLRKFYPYYEKEELKYVFGYGTDITEVKKAQLQKEEYIEQLENLAFTTSHKLRQPICNLQGLISLLEMKEFDNRQLEQIVGSLRASIGELDNFTRDLGEKLHQYKQNLSKQDDKC